MDADKCSLYRLAYDPVLVDTERVFCEAYEQCAMKTQGQGAVHYHGDLIDGDAGAPIRELTHDWWCRLHATTVTYGSMPREFATRKTSYRAFIFQVSVRQTCARGDKLRQRGPYVIEELR